MPHPRAAATGHQLLLEGKHNGCEDVGQRLRDVDQPPDVHDEPSALDGEHRAGPRLLAPRLMGGRSSLR